MIYNKKDKAVFALAVVLVIALFATIAAAVEPNGATVNPGTPETAGTDSPGEDEAVAGNITELTITGESITPAWQGYFGNVSGVIQLADASGDVLYNWTVASPSGEIYSSTNDSITWTNIQCFNFTAVGNYSDEAGNGGATNQYGTNLTVLESQYSIGPNDVDGVNETFTLLGSGHDLFTTASNEFAEGECPNTRIYDSTGTGVDNNFEEALLYEPSTYSVVFASILDSDVSGFDGVTHDFEMLVLEDGHGSNVASTTYYFFVEIE